MKIFGCKSSPHPLTNTKPKTKHTQRNLQQKSQANFTEIKNCAAAITFLGLLWAQLIYALHPNWLGHSYYDFGWFVALMVGHFVFVRWKECPGSSIPAFRLRWPWLLVAFLIIGLVPFRIVEHVDPYWRLPLWIHAVLVLSITHLMIALLRGVKTSIFLLPATLLIFLPIPLPSRLEDSFVFFLTGWVTNFTSSVLPFAGYPVVQNGNSFMVNGESVDVAEGCSGIRSFQSCLAAGFVLGELQRLSLLKRAFLLLAAIALAVLLNTGRVFVLVRITYEEGKQAMDAAHDQVGLVAAMATYLLIGILSWRLDRANRCSASP